MEQGAKVTRPVLEHVARSDVAVRNFRDNGVSGHRRLPLKVAREELQKAICSLSAATGCSRGGDAIVCHLAAVSSFRASRPALVERLVAARITPRSAAVAAGRDSGASNPV